MATFREKLAAFFLGGSVLSAEQFMAREVTSHPTKITRAAKEMAEEAFENMPRKRTIISRAMKEEKWRGAQIGAIARTYPSWQSLSKDAIPLHVDHKLDQSQDEAASSRPLWIDNRRWYYSIQDQGTEGSCTAYATIGALESLVYRRSYQQFKLSESIFWKSYHQKSLAEAMDVLSGDQAKGVPIVGVRGYASDLPRLRIRIPASAKPKLLETSTQILDAVANEEAVVIGVPTNKSFTESKNGWIDADEPTTDDAHAMAVVGYHVLPDRPENSYLIVRNSWGKTWGDEGYGYLPLRYCEIHQCVAYSIREFEAIKVGQ